MHEKSHFKTSTTVFSVLKNKQYILKINVTDSIDFMTADSVKKSIETSVNTSLNNDLIMIVSDFIIYKLFKFK